MARAGRPAQWTLYVTVPLPYLMLVVLFFRHAPLDPAHVRARVRAAARPPVRACVRACARACTSCCRPPPYSPHTSWQQGRVMESLRATFAEQAID
jgi:hypothetical protein